MIEEEREKKMGSRRGCEEEGEKRSWRDGVGEGYLASMQQSVREGRRGGRVRV